MATILVIDDDEQVLKVVKSYLVKEGHSITTAPNGKEGIKLLEREQFDLVITDMIMPEQDGVEVLLWLKKQLNRPRIIAISGGSVSMDLNYLLNMAGILAADKVLPKPVNYATLTDAVREVLL